MNISHGEDTQPVPDPPREVIDVDEQLDPADPNVAASPGTCNHLDHIGDDDSEELGIGIAAYGLLPVPADGA